MEHTLKAVDEELAALHGAVVEMGELAVNQVRAALDVFERHDATVAALVVAADKKLDSLEAEIERGAIRFIALRQPMADDLRRPIAAMKTAMQLERCGDLAKNIAKRVGKMGDRRPGAPTEALTELGALVSSRLATVIGAIRNEDAESARQVWSTDKDIDTKHESVLREVVACMAEHPDQVGNCTHLLFITKNLERIGDHATNIAELLHYQVTGLYLEDRPKL